jgi:hypothetical protein
MYNPKWPQVKVHHDGYCYSTASIDIFSSYLDSTSNLRYLIDLSTLILLMIDVIKSILIFIIPFPTFCSYGLPRLSLSAVVHVNIVQTAHFSPQLYGSISLTPECLDCSTVRFSNYVPVRGETAEFLIKKALKIAS